MATKSKPVKELSETPKPVEVETPKPVEAKLPVTLRMDNGYEYNLDLPQSVIDDIINPDVIEKRIEVPCPVRGARRFLHTSFIKELDVRGLE